MRIDSLRRGRLFTLPPLGTKGKLIYCNPCRAHVQLEDKPVVIKGKKFKVACFDDWAPHTVVEIKSGKGEA